MPPNSAGQAAGLAAERGAFKSDCLLDWSSESTSVGVQRWLFINQQELKEKADNSTHLSALSDTQAVASQRQGQKNGGRYSSSGFRGILLCHYCQSITSIYCYKHICLAGRTDECWIQRGSWILHSIASEVFGNSVKACKD